MKKIKAGLAAFIDREFTNLCKAKALEEANQCVRDERQKIDRPFAEWDAAALLQLMWDSWNSVFWQVPGQSERSKLSPMRRLLVCLLFLAARSSGPPPRPDARDFWKEIGAPERRGE